LLVYVIDERGRASRCGLLLAGGDKRMQVRDIKAALALARSL
jgi:putative component of toxin-antitoxin plasmid stabilization module